MLRNYKKPKSRGGYSHRQSSGIYATSTVSPSATASREFVSTPIGSISLPLPRPIAFSDDALTKSWKGTVALELIKSADPTRVSETDKLNAIGHILGCTTQIRAEKAKWINALKNLWQDPSSGHFAVIGFCDSAGVPLPNAHIPGNPAILKPIDAVTPLNAANRRPPDVAYALIRCSYVFNRVAPTYAHAFDRLDFEFHINLPQETRNALNGNNVPTPVTTFWGVADLSTLTRDQFVAQILSAPPFQQTPFFVTPAAPPATRAVSDDGKCFTSAQDHILRVMLDHNESTFLSAVNSSSGPSWRKWFKDWGVDTNWDATRDGAKVLDSW